MALLVRLFIAHGTEDWVVSIPIKTIVQVNRRSKLAKEVLVGRVWSGLVLKKKDIDFGCDGEVGKYTGAASKGRSLSSATVKKVGP